jgi:hypothetical protein
VAKLAPVKMVMWHPYSNTAERPWASEHAGGSAPCRRTDGCSPGDRQWCGGEKGAVPI